MKVETVSGRVIDIDNVTIHNYPRSAYIAKAAVYVRNGRKIMFRAVLRDEDASRNWLCRMGYDVLPIRVFNHK